LTDNADIHPDRPERPPSEWRKTTLGEAAVLSAKTVSPSELGDVPYIGLEHIAPDALRLSGNGAASDVVSAKTSFQKGDILFGKLRPYFRKVALAPFDGICSTDIWVVKPAKGVDARFLFYAMANQDFVDMAARESVGTRMPRAKWEYAARYEFPLPPISAQRRVSATLGALDDKIELNARMNETLDETARALFRAWFVDFAPVRAKMSGAWRRGESPPGLPAALYDAFPDAMSDSALGEIPAGWEVKALDEIAQFRNGLALQKLRPKEGEGRLPVVKIAQLRSGRADSGEWATSDITPECAIDDGDVIFAWSASLMVKVWTGGRAALNQHLFKVTSSEYPAWFYLEWVKSHLPEFRRIAEDKTTTMGHIKRGHLNEAKCVVPDRALLSAADDIFADTLAKRVAADVQSFTLAEVRDTLLPKLLSGEISA